MQKCGLIYGDNSRQVIYCVLSSFYKRHTRTVNRGKDEVHLVHAMKAYSGSRGIAALTLNLCTIWR